MKKSKVLIPAMALLLFSTAASITGTVAWFTSTRTFETSTGDFEVAKLDGNLGCQVTGLIGTDVTDNVISIIPDPDEAQATSAVLGDASFDHVNKVLYTDTDVANTYAPLDTMAANVPADGGYQAGDDDHWVYSTINKKTYWYAVAWNLRFSYDFVAETTGVNVFLNINASTMTRSTATSHESGNDTAKGFRIAFLSGSTAKVWGKLCDKNYKAYANSSWSSVAGGYNPCYVSSTGGTTNYTNANFIDASTTLEKATNSTTNQTERLDYLATIANPTTGGTAYINVTCVAWYEGSDPNVVDASIMARVRASMSFYACNANS